MAVGLSPKIDTLNLSKGQTFIQSVLLNLGQVYPAGTSARIVISDDAEVEIDTWYGDVAYSKAQFNQDNLDALNAIPHGARYELFIDYPDGSVEKFSYGRVVRNQNRYPLLPSQITTNYALQFSDSFDRDYLGNHWVPKTKNSVKIHQNPSPVPNSLGPNFTFFNKAALLWYAPLNSDDVTVSVSMVYVGDGICNVILCSDYSMTSYLGVQFSCGVANNKIRIIKAAGGPTTWDTVAGFTPVNNSITTGDNYLIKYNNQMKTIYVYKNGSLSPVATWLDSLNIIPNGAGYRYTGLSFSTAAFTPGPEVTSWSARDGV